MKYVPRSRSGVPNHNVSGGSIIKEVLRIFSSVLIALFLSFAAMSVIVEGILSFDKELVLNAFAYFTPEQKNLPLNEEDSAFLARLNDVFLKLRDNLPDKQGIKLHLVLKPDHSPNALAYPDGTIVVHSALRNMLTSDNEIGMVLAHELGHYYNGDHLSNLSKASSFVIMSALLTSAGVSSGDTLGVFLQWVLFSYSREQERAADKFGIDLLYKTYGSVEGASGFFEKLKKTEVGIFRSLFESRISSTHPDTEERLEYLKKRATELVGIDRGK